MKKLKKILMLLLLIMIISTFSTNYKTSIADVGSFEDYDSSSWSSGSSSSSGSWSSSSSSLGSGSSSSRSDDRSYSSSSGYSGAGTPMNSTEAGIIMFAFIFVFVAVIVILLTLMYINNHSDDEKTSYHYQSTYNFDTEENVERKIKAVDELFDKQEFLSWTSNLFVKLQNAWTARDWNSIRIFETSALFEQHQKQLQGYIDRKQINVMEAIQVLSVELADFKQTGFKDVVTVVLKSRMVDYIVDETTGVVIKGDKVTYRYSTYKLDFIRTTGEKTKPGPIEINTTNCPNCGAITQITSAGKCEYCGSVITTGEHNWALSNLEKIG